MSDNETFASYMAQERDRLHTERDALVAQQSDISQQISLINRELQAVDAYEAAKAGKLPGGAKPARHRRSNGGASRARTGRREGIIQMLQNHVDGLTRGELLEALDVKGDRSGEMSVSNALTAMIKNSILVRGADRRYQLNA